MLILSTFNIRWARWPSYHAYFIDSTTLHQPWLCCGASTLSLFSVLNCRGAMSLIERAIELAAVAHKGQVRKGTAIPYVSHPYAVGMMLARVGCDEALVAAGILHDTVEDTYITLADLRVSFGERVAAIVAGCSEPDKRASWEARKQHTLHYLATAPREVRVVTCADKLHNVSTMLEAYTHAGEGLWLRFNRGRADQEWYYRGLVAVLCAPRPEEEPLPFCGEFAAAVEALFTQPLGR